MSAGRDIHILAGEHQILGTLSPMFGVRVLESFRPDRTASNRGGKREVKVRFICGKPNARSFAIWGYLRPI